MFYFIAAIWLIADFSALLVHPSAFVYTEDASFNERWSKSLTRSVSTWFHGFRREHQLPHLGSLFCKRIN
jgi:hypothetical protein